MLKRIGRIFLLGIFCFALLWCWRVYSNVKQVLTYESMVEEVLAEHQSNADEDLILAMIYTETKGNADDVMQSSESATGMANSITDSKTSVHQGVTVLTENLALAEEVGVDVWTAVQAYNFGQNYINYVAKNGGVSTVELARSYSREVVAPSLGNTIGETYRYYNPIALVYGGGELYKNGGNIYYAKEVRVNRLLIQVVRLFLND
ncbi:lysozyme family protein [Streptococcus caprae]|uniref:Lysozyme family protein n=1 Tax=Streptococcus caprae TaxID=1640501 RepID=A0ABV8CVX7_9STRE